MSPESGPDPEPATRRDLNGRPVRVTRAARWRSLLRREAPLTVDEPGLEVVAQGWDEAVAGSEILDAAHRWHPDAQAVLRHLLALPSGRIADAAATAALDGYSRADAVPNAEAASGTGADVDSEPDEAAPDPSPGGPLTSTPVAFERVQLVDALHLAQERSRMASLAARHGGTVLGWQIRQRPH